LPDRANPDTQPAPVSPPSDGRSRRRHQISANVFDDSSSRRRRPSFSATTIGVGSEEVASPKSESSSSIDARWRLVVDTTAVRRHVMAAPMTTDVEQYSLVVVDVVSRGGGNVNKTVSVLTKIGSLTVARCTDRCRSR